MIARLCGYLRLIHSLLSSQEWAYDANGRQRKEKIMEDMKEFVAYSRKLLRILNKLENALENKEYEKALEMVRELKEDTQKDIEA